jgi:hypothetical protein
LRAKLRIARQPAGGFTPSAKQDRRDESASLPQLLRPMYLVQAGRHLTIDGVDLTAADRV